MSFFTSSVLQRLSRPFSDSRVGFQVIDDHFVVDSSLKHRANKINAIVQSAGFCPITSFPSFAFTVVPYRVSKSLSSKFSQDELWQEVENESKDWVTDGVGFTVQDLTCATKGEMWATLLKNDDDSVPYWIKDQLPRKDDEVAVDLGCGLGGSTLHFLISLYPVQAQGRTWEPIPTDEKNSRPLYIDISSRKRQRAMAAACLVSCVGGLVLASSYFLWRFCPRDNDDHCQDSYSRAYKVTYIVGTAALFSCGLVACCIAGTFLPPKT